MKGSIPVNGNTHTHNCLQLHTTFFSYYIMTQHTANVFVCNSISVGQVYPYVKSLVMLNRF